MKKLLAVSAALAISGVIALAGNNPQPTRATSPGATAPVIAVSKAPATNGAADRSVSHTTELSRKQIGTFKRIQAEGLFMPRSNKQNAGATIETIMGTRNNDVFAVLFPTGH
jgi:hypothetical protein